MNKFLVRYRRGLGSLWAYVLAESAEQIETKFENIEILDEPPEWFSAELEAAIQTYAVDKPGGWLPLAMRKA